MEINCVTADIREEVLNVALDGAFHRYSELTAKGEPVPKLKSEYSELIRKVLEDKVPRLLEAVEIDGAPVE